MRREIDLKWFLPFIAPFVTIGIARGVWMFAGLLWVPTQEGIGITLIVSFLIGAFLAAFLAIEGIKWVIYVGGKDETQN